MEARATIILWAAGTRTISGAYIHDELVLGRRWILSAGIRADKDSQFGWEASPQAGIVFKAGEDTSLRFSTAKAFRSPAINELYLFPPSNPSLQPERVWNLEFGVDQAVGRNLFLTAAVFRMKGTNLIETALNPGGYPPYKFQNTGKFMFYGTEIGLRAFPSSFSFCRSFLFIPGCRRPDQGQARKQDRRRHPLDLGPFRAFLNAQHVSHYYAADKRALPIPSYFLLNARVEFSIRHNLGVFADVNNITGEDYKIYADLAGQAAGLYQMPGRNVHFGFRTGF